MGKNIYKSGQGLAAYCSGKLGNNEECLHGIRPLSQCF
jgi:hypothetical protein